MLVGWLTCCWLWSVQDVPTLLEGRGAPALASAVYECIKCQGTSAVVAVLPNGDAVGAAGASAVQQDLARYLADRTVS